LACNGSICISARHYDGNSGHGKKETKNLRSPKTIEPVLINQFTDTPLQGAVNAASVESYNYYMAHRGLYFLKQIAKTPLIESNRLDAFLHG
jgi:hypothetical protein